MDIQRFQHSLLPAMLASVMGLSLPNIALAETQKAKEQQNTENTQVIEEIEVFGSYIVNDRLDTATGLGLTLQETPQSVSIVTSLRIADQNLRSLEDIVNTTPGISSKAFDSSRAAFSARGFDIDNYQIDGVPVQWDGSESAGETQLDPALYQRIEIVRGATGLLTGVGNPSASINLVRKRADSVVLEGFVSAGLGRWDTYRLVADVGRSLNASGTVRGRAVMVYEDADSYTDFMANEKQVLYGVIDADLTPNTMLSVGASYQDNNPTASMWGGLPIFFSDGTRTNWERSKTTGADWTHWSTTHKTAFASLSHRFNNDWVAEVTVSQIISSSRLELLFLFGSPDPTTGLGMGALPAWYDNERKQNDIGIRVTGMYELFGREHEVVFGVSHNQQDFIYDAADAIDAAPVGNFFEWDGSYPKPTWGEIYRLYDYETDQTGYYAATRLSLADPLKVILGMRVTDWERTGFDSFAGDSEYGDDGVVVPYAGALYDLTSQHTLYASYTKIFQPQEAQDRNGNLLDPLLGHNTEIGLKSRFFDDKLHTTATLFLTRQDNLAVPDSDFAAPPSDPFRSAFIAEDGVETKGIELEIVGEIMPGWNVSASYTDFDATAEESEGESNAVNTRFPTRLLRLFTTYEWNKWTVGGGVNWEGESYTLVTNPATGASERATQESFTLVNVMARYQFNDQLSAQLNIDNLFDETYFAQIGFFTQLAYGEPRNVNLTVKYDF